MNKKALLVAMLSVAPTVLGAVSPVMAEEKAPHKVEQKESDRVAERVFYNGKEVVMKEEPKAIRDAKPVTSGNHQMGSQNKMGRSARVGCDVFTVGDKSRPRQDFVDVSSYQGAMSQKDYNTLKARGVKGVVVKLTEGTYYTNPYAKQQIQFAKNAGMKVSVYHFSQFQNKAQAEAEADFFAKTAKSLGLGKDVLMVNDIESGNCNNGYATQNSVYFALRLIRTHGIQSVLHYGYQNWFDTGVLNKNTLGADSIWEAGYPYSPSANNLWYKGSAEAWQFTSTMKLPSGSNYTGYLDGNIDYTGRFTKEADKPVNPSIKEEKLSTYGTVMNGSANLYEDMKSMKVCGTTKALKDQTFHVTKKVTRDGDVYYYLSTQSGKGLGYIEADSVKLADTAGGAWFDTKDHLVKATKDTPLWRGFDFDSKKGTMTPDDTYMAKGEYHHVNGQTYLSLYDKDGNWKGYVLAKDTGDGFFLDHYEKNGNYYTVKSDKSDIYKDRNLTKVGMEGKDVVGKTYFAKGQYKAFNGQTYLSLYTYDEKAEDGLKWLGYIPEENCAKADSKGGTYINNKSDLFVSVAKPDYDLWSNFDFTKSKGKAKEGHWYVAERYYKHFNGATYQSVYEVNPSNGERKWAGYINNNALQVEDNNFGEYHSFKRNIKVLKDGYGVYKDKNFKNKVNTSDKLKGKTFLAKGYYDRLPSKDGSHGGRYYSLYDNNGKWQGYIKSTACEVLK